jgi:hypothetical protein
LKTNYFYIIKLATYFQRQPSYLVAETSSWPYHVHLHWFGLMPKSQATMSLTVLALAPWVKPQLKRMFLFTVAPQRSQGKHKIFYSTLATSVFADNISQLDCAVKMYF